MEKTFRRMIVGTVVVAGSIALGAGPSAAHVHSIERNGQTIANGQHHPVFNAAGLSCDTSAGPGGAAIGPAWYGLEVAHHGPDIGTAGKGDGCYQTTVTLTAPYRPTTDKNPAIN
jgi:hypothetical protein